MHEPLRERCDLPATEGTPASAAAVPVRAASDPAVSEAVLPAGGTPVLAEDACGETKVLTFYLGGEEFGLELASVQELLDAAEMVPGRCALPLVRGTVCCAGNAVPVVDLRETLHLPDHPRTPESCVVVVQAGGRQAGIMADRVSEILDLPGRSASARASAGGWVRAVGPVRGKERQLLDVNQVMRNLAHGGLPKGGRP
jgi:purine-binding chemotaxis protein CheW